METSSFDFDQIIHEQHETICPLTKMRLMVLYYQQILTYNLNATTMFELDNIMNNDTVKNVVDKAKGFVNTEKGRETLHNAKEKIEDFVEEKTDGKGILGFGKKE